MEEEKQSIWTYILVWVISFLTSVAVAIKTQYIKTVGIPVVVFVLSMALQVVMSSGCFLATILLFRADVLPGDVADNEFLALFAAFCCGTVPHILIPAALFFGNKEIDKLATDRYGESLSESDNKRYDEYKKMKDLTDTYQPKKKPKRKTSKTRTIKAKETAKEPTSPQPEEVEELK